MDKEFTIRTGHMSLKWLLATKDATGRIMRWIMAIQEFKYVIEYIKGKDNVVADTLTMSRIIHKVKKSDYEPKEQLTEDQKREIIQIHQFESGHGGIEPTYILMLRERQWEGMYKDVETYIKECEVCQRYTLGPRNLQKFRIALENHLIWWVLT